MPVYKFPINGLRHHDFANCLDNLYDSAIGQVITLGLDKDNLHERDAVMACLGKRTVGYVRSGIDRERAASLIHQSPYRLLRTRVISIDRENHWLWVEIETELKSTATHAPQNDFLADYDFDGPTLPSSESETMLHFMISALRMNLESKEPWSQGNDEYLEFIVQNLWVDMSQETYVEINQIREIIRQKSSADKAFSDAEIQLTKAIDHMGSPEVRQMQIHQIRLLAQSPQMDQLLVAYGDKAQAAVDKLPAMLMKLFFCQPEMLMSQLWYHHPKAAQLSQILTLLALRVRINNDAQKNIDIPEEQTLPCEPPVQTLPHINLSTARGTKTAFIITLNSMFENGMFTDENGQKPVKKDFFHLLGTCFNTDLSRYSNNLSQSMSANTLDSQLRIFDHLKQTHTQIYNSK